MKRQLRTHVRQLLEAKYAESLDEEIGDERRRLIRREAYKLTKKSLQLKEEVRMLCEDLAAQRPYGLRKVMADGPPITHITTSGN